MSNNNPSPASSEESIIVVLHPEVPPYLPPTPSRPRPPPPAAQASPLTPSAPRISTTRPRPASEDFDDLDLSEPAPKRQRKDLAKTPVKTPASKGQASFSVASASKTSSSRPRASAVVTTPQQPPLASTIKAAATKRTPKRAVLSSSEDDDEPGAPLRRLAPSPKYLAVRKTPKRAALSSSDEATPLAAGSSTQAKASVIKKPTTKKAAVAALKKPAAAAAPTPPKATRRRLSFSVEPEMTTSTSASTTASNTTATSTPTPAATITKVAAGSIKSATPSKPAPSAPVSVTKKTARVPSPTKKPRVVPSWEYTDDPLPAVKGYDSGIAALESRGLLDPNAGRQLRGGRVLQAPTGEKVTRNTRAKNRWGELEEKRDEEEAMTGDAEDVLKEEGTTEDERPILPSPTKKRGRPPKKPIAATKMVESAEDEMDWDPIASLPAASFESLPAFSSHVATSLNGAVASAASQPVIDLSVLPSSFHQHLPSTKALVLSHLVGRTPPLPAPVSSSSTPATSSLDAKGKERTATSPTQSIDNDDDEAISTLVELLRGTVVRGEGNSCLIQGVRGSGKTTVLNAALRRIATESANDNLAEPPIVVRLSALLQKDDRAAIREIGRQVGVSGLDELAAEEDHVLQPTTLPAHLLAILTEPSRKAIVVVLDEFDLFAGFGRGGRQMLLYCLLDVVQSIRPSLGAPTSRGVAVVGLTSRIDTLHLLEKRVKSRFSHRIIRVNSPLNGDRSHLALARESLPAGMSRIRFNGAIEEADEDEEEEEEPEQGWVGLVGRALVPWERGDEIGEEGEWRRSWRESIETVLTDPAVRSGMNRLSWLTTDVRALLRPFIRPILELTPATPLLTPSRLLISLSSQAESPGWGHHLRKLAGLSLPALCILAAVKDLGERGITEFTFEHLVFTYGEFAKAKLVGSGKARFGRGMLKDAFTHLVSTSLLFHASALSTTSASASSASALDFAKIRCAVPAFDIVEFFRGEGGKGVMTQLVAWGRKWDV